MPRFPDSQTVIEPDCSRCPALVESREHISWGTGAVDAEVLVVGEAPGAGTPDADRWKGGNWTGMAYTSRHSGRRVREMMADVGYDPIEDCYFTNAVKCFPSADEGSNREPTTEELGNCRPHLEREIGTVDPQVVIPTGKHATETLLAFDDRTLDGFLDVVLEPIECETLGVTLLPILHPSYQDVWIARLGYTRELYLRELESRLAECR